MPTPNLLITHYTFQEAGYWFPWEAGELTSIAIDKYVHYSLLLMRPRTVRINGIKIHAVKLSDGRVWDCFNGFRQFRSQ